AVAAGHPPGLRDQRNAEVRAGPAVAKTRECTIVENLRALVELVEPLLPRGRGVVLVEPQRVGDGLPQPIDVGLAEDLLRPPLGRAGDQRPGDLAVRDRLEPLALDGGVAGAPDATEVEARVDLLVGAARDADQRSA